MNTHRLTSLVSAIVLVAAASGCASPAPSTTNGGEETRPSGSSSTDIAPEKRAKLEQAFCTETLAYLARTSDEQVPGDCKGVIMRRTDQFGHGQNEGYLVTVIVGEEREKIELGAVVTPGGEVKLRSLQSGLERAAVQEAEIGIRNVRSLVDQFYLRTDPKRLPDALQELVDQGLAPQEPIDPWGAPYIYERESSTEFTVYSAGPDGQAGTLDDVRVE